MVPYPVYILTEEQYMSEYSICNIIYDENNVSITENVQ